MPATRAGARPGPPDLLVVGDRRPRRLVVDDEGEVGLVEAHAEGRGGDDDLHLVGEQGLLDGRPRGRRRSRRCRRPPRCPATRSHPATRSVSRDGEAVDDARCPAAGGCVSASHASRSAWRADVEHVQAQAVAASGPRTGHQVGAELGGDVVDHPVVGRRGAAQHRHAGGQQVEHADEPAVVGAEVVAPVGDAVGLVDDEQPAAARRPRAARRPGTSRWRDARAR